MCPVVFLAFLFSLLMVLLEVSSALQITLSPSSISQLREGDQKDVVFSVKDTAPGPYFSDLEATVSSEDKGIAQIVGNSSWYFNNSVNSDGTWNGTFTVKGAFLGVVQVRVKARKNPQAKEPGVSASKDLRVEIIRKEGILSTIFIYSVAILVSLNYINMGCALDLSVVKSVLVKPVAPVLGFLCQFLVMPLVAFGVGKVLFEDKYLQLGLFTFGCSPGGGASNMWTVLLAGNLNLSITLTFISTACALFMMPFWLFTLGRSLFQGSITKLPYRNIFTSLVSMVVPLGIGLIVQRYLPKTAKFCRRIIAPASILMILYIIVFGTYSNLYMFKIMTWRVIVAATMNVWIGFLAGLIVAKIFRQNCEDIIAICIETGVQNTGISIVLLGTSLTQPYADLASVVPVAASIMTPIPLLIAMFFKKMYHCYRNDWSLKDRYVPANDENKQMVNSPSVLSSVSDEKVQTNGNNGHMLI